MEKEMHSIPIRISVVDDHPIVFSGIKLIIKKAKNIPIKLVNQYSRGNDLINDLDNLNSDVLIIGNKLSDMKGYELTKIVLNKYPDIRIGIYSAMLDRENILNSFKAGVHGYLPKSAESAELLDFIITLYKGQRYIRGIVADTIFESQNFFKNQPSFNITRRETEILQLILEGHKNKEIAEILSIAERTVEFHKQNIYLKLDVNNSVDLYKTVIKYKLLPDKNVFFSS
jgi:DNA-binding NarL/FixJ family response regulator